VRFLTALSRSVAYFDACCLSVALQVTGTTGEAVAATPTTRGIPGTREAGAGSSPTGTEEVGGREEVRVYVLLCWAVRGNVGT
jgi:hypothetical protein